MMRPLALITLVLAPLAACASSTGPPDSNPISVVRSGDLDEALRGVRLIALHPTARIVRADAVEDEQRARGAMQLALERWASGRGLRWVVPAQAEVQIAYALGLEGRLEDEELARAFGVTAGLEVPGSGRRGGLVISLLDTRTNQSAWRGSVSGRAEEDALGDPSPGAQIDRAVRRLLEGEVAVR